MVDIYSFGWEVNNFLKSICYNILILTQSSYIDLEWIPYSFFYFSLVIFSIVYFYCIFPLMFIPCMPSYTFPLLLYPITTTVCSGSMSSFSFAGPLHTPGIAWPTLELSSCSLFMKSVSILLVSSVCLSNSTNNSCLFWCLPLYLDSNIIKPKYINYVILSCIYLLCNTGLILPEKRWLFWKKGKTELANARGWVDLSITHKNILAFYLKVFIKLEIYEDWDGPFLVFYIWENSYCSFSF